MINIIVRVHRQNNHPMLKQQPQSEISDKDLKETFDEIIIVVVLLVIIICITHCLTKEKKTHKATLIESLEPGTPIYNIHGELIIL